MWFVNFRRTLHPWSGAEVLSPRGRGPRRSRRATLQMEEVERRVVLSNVFVSPTGSFNGQPAFTTIQNGVLAARPGDTIQVAGGTYNENVTVNKPVTILGARAGINPTGPFHFVGPTSVVNGSFTVTANNVTVNGFTVQTAHGRAIQDANGVGGLTVADNTLQNSLSGVTLFADHAATVRDNLFTSDLDGIDVNSVFTILTPTSPPVATNDVISGNSIQGSGTVGLQIDNLNNSQVNNNLIQNTGFIGAAVHSSNGNAFSNNRVLGTGSSGDGFQISGSNSNTFQSNLVRATGANGIELSGGTGDRFIQNTVDDAGLFHVGNGFVLTNATGGLVQGNAVDSSFGAGVVVSGSTGVVIDSNLLTNNHAQGVSLFNSSGISVDTNAISGNFAGVVLSNTNNSTVKGNRVQSSQADGIDVSSSKGNALLSNVVAQSGGAGIVAVGVANTVVSGDTVSNNTHGGIDVFSNSVGVTVASNTVQGNGGDGILLLSVTTSTVANNTVLNSGNDNITLIGATANQVRNNTARGAKSDGIHVDSRSIGNTLSTNLAQGNSVFDLEDDSAGGLTAGTANTWTGNIEGTDNHHGGLGVVPPPHF